MTELLYIGPSMGAGAIALTLLIGGVVVAALSYIVWLRLKKILKK